MTAASRRVGLRFSLVLSLPLPPLLPAVALLCRTVSKDDLLVVHWAKECRYIDEEEE